MKVKADINKKSKGLDITLSLTKAESYAVAHLTESIVDKVEILTNDRYLNAVLSYAEAFAKQQYSAGDRSMPSSFGAENYTAEMITWYCEHKEYPGNAEQRRLAKEKKAQEDQDNKKAAIAELDDEQTALLED